MIAAASRKNTAFDIINVTIVLKSIPLPPILPPLRAVRPAPLPSWVPQPSTYIWSIPGVAAKLKVGAELNGALWTDIDAESAEQAVTEVYAVSIKSLLP